MFFPTTTNTAFLSLATYLWHLTLLSDASRATQWTVRSYAVLTSTVTTDTFALSETFTDTSTIYLTSPSPVPTASPYSSTALVESELNVTYITYFLPPNAVPQAVLATATSDRIDSINTVTEFYIPIEYTAPSSCPSHFTYTTSSLISVPDGAESQVTPTASTASTDISGDVIVSALLTAGAVPLSTPPTTTDFIYQDFIASCSSPAPTSSYAFGPAPTSDQYYGGGLRSGGDDDDIVDDNIGCLGSLCPFWLIYIIVFCTTIPLLFLMGLVESYFWFSRLMKGRSAFRGVPLCWIAISLWTLCCLRRSQNATPEQQPLLEKQWREMGTGTRLGLWFKYGFRHRDPPQVAAVRASSQQQSMANMYQVPQAFYPPPSHPGYVYQPSPESQATNAYYPPPNGAPNGMPGSPPPQQQSPPPQQFYPSPPPANGAPNSTPGSPPPQQQSPPPQQFYPSSPPQQQQQQGAQPPIYSPPLVPKQQ